MHRIDGRMELGGEALLNCKGFAAHSVGCFCFSAKVVNTQEALDCEQSTTSVTINLLRRRTRKFGSPSFILPTLNTPPQKEGAFEAIKQINPAINLAHGSVGTHPKEIQHTVLQFTAPRS